MKKTVIKQYAKLIAVKGVNIQKGQEVIINASVENPEFVKILTEECYKAGASKVMIEWSYQPLTKVNYRYRTIKTLSKLENWEIEKLKHRTEVLPAMIYIDSEDPDGLAGINQEKMAKAQQAIYPIVKPYRDKMENRYQWCIAAVPGENGQRRCSPEKRRAKLLKSFGKRFFIHPEQTVMTLFSLGTSITRILEAVAIILILLTSRSSTLHHLMVQISRLV